MSSSQKTIYLVRHAESEGNVGVVRTDLSHDTVPLTEHGHEQAKAVAERAARLDIDVVISSTMTRARETAAAIIERTGKPIEYADAFTERRRPSVTFKLPNDNPERLSIEKTIAQNFHKDGYRHSDEENFDDLKVRAIEALDYLSARPETNILVVTHGMFLRVLAAYAVFGPDFTAHECTRFMRALRTENAGLTVFKYDPASNPAFPWWLWIWNDHAHLG